MTFRGARSLARPHSRREPLRRATRTVADFPARARERDVRRPSIVAARPTPDSDDAPRAPHSRRIAIPTLHPFRLSRGSMTARGRRVAAFAAGALVALASTFPTASQAAEPKPGPTVTIRRAAGPITLDGDLSDPGWKGADSLKTWYETNPGDNTEPAAHNLAFLTYDDRYFYAAFQFDDPHPELIRAPLGDHDGISSANDYGGLILDSRNEGKTAQMFLATPCGVEYDAVSSDVSGEDSSPDYYWDAVGKVTATGWNLEIRVPLSSLRYSDAEHPTWRVLLYRNYPR